MKLRFCMRIAVLCLLAATSAWAQNVQLQWTMDETPADLAGYRIYLGTESHVDAPRPLRHTDEAQRIGDDAEPYQRFMEVAGSGTTEAVVNDLEPGATYYFRATAVRQNGIESNFSAEEPDATIPEVELPDEIPPNAPTLFQVTAVRTAQGGVRINVFMKGPRSEDEKVVE